MAKYNQTTPFNVNTSKNINSISLEQNEPLVEHTLGKHPVLSSRKDEAISDPGSITTTALMHKPIVFANDLSWSVGQEVNTIIFTATLVSLFEMLNVSPGGQNLRGNAFFRSGARVELKLSSSPFHAGKLVFYYVPPGVDETFRESIFAKVQYPCVFVDAGNSTTGVLDIPFVAIKDFFSTVNPDGLSDLGSINVAVFNPLRIGTGGPTEVQLALTLHPTNNQIALPVYAHDIEIQGVGTELADAVRGTIFDGTQGIVDNLPAGGLFSLLRDAMIKHESAQDNMAKENAPLFTPLDDSPANNIPSIISSIMNNLDKPGQSGSPGQIEPPPNPNNTSSQTKTNTSAPTLANPAGISTEHLSLLPEKTFVESPPHEEMNLSVVMRTPSLLQTAQWSDSSDSGTILFRAPVDPRLVPYLPSSSGRGIVYPTYLSHVIEPFAYWRGSIDFHISFAGTEQHKGKVIAAWIPYDSIQRDGTSFILQGNPTVEQLSLYPNEIFDLSLNKEFSFSVPYNSETPFRYITDVDQLISVNPSDPLATQSTLRDHTLGSFYVLVYNKLSHPSTVTSTIDFNVFIKAGQDFQVRALKYNDDLFQNFQKINYITLQGLDVVYESTRNGIMKEQVNRVGISDSQISRTTFQQDSSEHNLNLLLQKYYPQIGFNIAIDAGGITRLVINSTPGLSFRQPRDNTDPATNPDPRWRNLIAHYRDIYAFWHGSLNYFIIHNTTVNNPIILMASHDPRDYSLATSPVDIGTDTTRTNPYSVSISREYANEEDLSETSIYSHISNLRVNPTIEITTPYRSIYRRVYSKDTLIAQADGPDQTESIGNIDIKYANPGTEAQTVSGLIYQSIGDDFQFKYLIPPPSLKTR